MNLNFSEDTITAVATPMGTGAIAIVRISGVDSIAIADEIFVGKKKLSECETHTIHYGKIYDSTGDIIDDVLVSIFISPNSFTGENCVEISSHGNPLITKKIIEVLLEKGVRNATPGEFTKRAFLNGKIDLAQAEAVAEVINSRTEVSLKGARNQLDGMLSKKVADFRTDLINTSSLIELELDFAEEEIEFVGYEKLQELILGVITEIDELLKSYNFGRVIRDGVNVALVGKPNVGKSSLLNYILKESRSIVSAIPGTTRDIIREEVSIDGILFKLFDTAGIRESEDLIEIEGVLRSREAIRDADFVILLSDVNDLFSEVLYEELLEVTIREKIILVGNKIDLKKERDFSADCLISAKTGEGIEKLFDLLKSKAVGNNVYTERSAIVTNSRHYLSLERTKSHLLTALESARSKMSGEFIAFDLRNAENSLSEIIGEVSSDDILNNIFASFCIGK